MLDHLPYRHSLIKKYVIFFGHLFNELDVVRYDTNDVEINRLRVPLAYGPKEKFYLRALQNPLLEDENVSVVLPRIGFQLESLTYNGDRKLPSILYNSKIKTGDKTIKNQQYTAVPYDLNFNLYILVDLAEDGTQIIEQILPFFAPEFCQEVNVIPELGIHQSIPVVLNSVIVEDNYDTTDFQTKRTIMWTLSFVMHAYLYGPVKEIGVIKKVIVDTHLTGGSSEDTITDQDVANTPRHVRLTVTPEPSTAGPEDDFGFNEVWESFNDGKKRNPHTRLDEDI